MTKTGFKKEIRLSGSGGQGLITAGIILAKAAVYDGMRVTQTQSYGPESRGGASRADVIISDQEIYFPEATRFDILLSLTQEACDKYADNVKPNGILIADSTQIKNVNAQLPQIYELPLTDNAIKELGSELPTNIVSLAFLVRIAKVVREESLIKAVKESVKKKYVNMNLKAIRLGFRLADEYK
ncbi:MAG: 2-oxoacid:acceptor oxidoreductase family protein [Candidatus Cloacimonetes bacterium]|nr:2-oxoacid:acceptor oxidoreductase family protein [Candidatus Cloacimonadota bacterium]